MDGAAAAFATLLAAAHEHCFRGAGDISVWARLRAVVSFRTSDVGGAVRDIAKALDLPWDTSGTEGLIHVLPFLRLAGCPSQGQSQQTCAVGPNAVQSGEHTSR